MSGAYELRLREREVTATESIAQSFRMIASALDRIASTDEPDP